MKSKIEIKCFNTTLFYSSNARKIHKVYSSSSEMKSYCTLCNWIFYYFWVRLFKLSFFLFRSFCPKFSLSFNFFSSALPIFSGLSLFSIARKKESDLGRTRSGLGLTERRRSKLGCARRGGWRLDLGLGLPIRPGFAEIHLGFANLGVDLPISAWVSLISAWVWTCWSLHE